MIATGGTALRSMVWPSEPSVATSSSWTILTTIWPGVTDLTTVAPTACSRTRSVKSLTTSSATSASSSARRTSRIAASTSFSDSAPRPVRRSSIPPSRSDRLSNNAVVLLLPLRALPSSPRSYPAKAGYPVRRSLSVQPELLWDTGSPAFAGDDDLDMSRRQTPKRYSKHFRARGRIALSGVGLRSQGPGGGSKRKSFREVPGKPRRLRKSRRNWSRSAPCGARRRPPARGPRRAAFEACETMKLMPPMLDWRPAPTSTSMMPAILA